MFNFRMGNLNDVVFCSQVPNVDVYLVRAGLSGGGKGGDSCGWHKLIEQLRKKLAQRLGGGTVSETLSDEQVVKYLGGWEV